MHRSWPLLVTSFILTGCVTNIPRQPASEKSVYAEFAGLSSVVSLSSGTTADLREVTGLEQEVWVRGENIQLKRVENSWAQAADWPKSEDRKQNVWEGSPNDVWTVTEKGTVAHSDGKLLETRTLSSAPLNSVCGVKIGSFENIWIVGDQGVILFFDGVLWQDISSGTKENLSSVWVDPSGTAWIVGNKGLILRSVD